MNHYALLSLGALVVNIMLAGYILSKNPTGAAARIYTLLLAAFILWDIPEFILRGFPSGDKEQLLLLTRVEWTGISFIPGLMSHFVLAYPRRSPLLARPWSLLVIYTPSVVFASFLWAGDLLVEDVAIGPLGYSAVVGLLYLPLASLYALIILVAFVHLTTAYRQAEDSRSRRRSALILVGFSFPVLVGTVTEVYGPFIFQLGTRVGLGTVYTTVFAAFVAYAIFRHGFLVIEPATEVLPVRQTYGWERGRNYLVLERGRRNSFVAFRELVQDVPGLCVTAFPPQILGEEFSIGRTPFLWLSSQKDYEWSLKPTYLEVDVLQTVLRFMKENKGAVILLDDVEYLSQVNGFPSTLRTVSRLTAAASREGCTLLVNMSPSSMESRQIAALKAAFDEIQTPAEEAPKKPLFISPGSILWEGERAECFEAISKVTLSPKILVSSIFPKKLQEAYGLYDASFLWITATSHPRFLTRDPSRLAFEVLRDVSRGIQRDSLVYLGELDLLAEHVDFLTVLEYVKHLIDAAMAKSGLVVASIAKGSFSPRRLAILEKRFGSKMA